MLPWKGSVEPRRWIFTGFLLLTDTNTRLSPSTRSAMGAESRSHTSAKASVLLASGTTQAAPTSSSETQKVALSTERLRNSG